MNKSSILLVAALLFGAAILIQLCIAPRKGLSQTFIDEVCEVLVTLSTFAFMVGVLFF